MQAKIFSQKLKLGMRNYDLTDKNTLNQQLKRTIDGFLKMFYGNRCVRSALNGIENTLYKMKWHHFVVMNHNLRFVYIYFRKPLRSQILLLFHKISCVYFKNKKGDSFQLVT